MSTTWDGARDATAAGARRSGLIIAAGAMTGLLAVGVLGCVMAITGASFGCLSSQQPTGASAGVADIPAARLVLYRAAGRRFDLDWTFLASIGAQECNHGSCRGNNGSGCAGPMQIADRRRSPCSPGAGPTLFERYGVDADHDGRRDVNDPADAIFTAARILRQAKHAPATGGSYTAYRQAACSYYGACADAAAAYADEVMHRAVTYGFPSQPATPDGPPPDGGCAALVASPGLAAAGSDVVRVASREVGEGEHPPGSNCSRYGPCEDWCALFVAWVWQHAATGLPGPTARWGYSGSLLIWARAHHGRVLPATATPAPGDAVLYGQDPEHTAHIGIVARVLPDGQIETIEGNYADHVTRVGPFTPARAEQQVGAPAPIYAYAQPPTAPATKPLPRRKPTPATPAPASAPGHNDARRAALPRVGAAIASGSLFASPFRSLSGSPFASSGLVSQARFWPEEHNGSRPRADGEISLRLNLSPAGVAHAA